MLAPHVSSPEEKPPALEPVEREPALEPEPAPQLDAARLPVDGGEAPVADPGLPASNDDPAQPTVALDGRAARAERRRAQRRHAILEAAKRVLREKGYHQASVHDIIDEARIARGTFYLYFNSKQEVFGELVAEFLQALRGQVKRISLAPGSPAPLEQLHANFRRVVTTVLAHDDVATIILRHPVGFDEESGAKVDLFFDQVRQMVEDALRVGQSLGLLRACNTHIVAAASLAPWAACCTSASIPARTTRSTASSAGSCSRTAS